MEVGMASANGTNRGLWSAIIFLAALLLGVIAGAVMRASGSGLPEALQVGGTAFLGLAGLGMAIHRFVTA